MTDARTLPKTHASVTGDGSALGRYQDVVVGKRSLTTLLYFEFCMWLAGVPGALGLLLRQVFWPRMFASCGKKVFFGRNVSVMHPGRIHIGSRTVIGDNCVLDGRNPQKDSALTLGAGVMLSHGVVLSCKNGSITIGDRCGFGPYSVVQSVHGNEVTIGDDVVCGSYCFVTGGGNYNTDRIDVPISQQGTAKSDGTHIGNGVWLGARASAVGGVSIGHDAIVGTGAVVTKSLPDFSVSVGMPARVMRQRDE